MLNKKTILISGFSRGGTNILWNILQSHPLVCAPEHETGAIFRYPEHLKFSHFIKFADKFGFLYTNLSRHIIDYQLYRYKMKNLHKADNKYKYEDDIYTKSEVSNSTLCLKSVDKDIFQTELLLEVYPEMYVIFLVRNGYAIAEGHFRRGISIKESAENYVQIGREMHRILQERENSTIIKFENVLDAPFQISESLYTFAHLKPKTLKKLRLKSKKIKKDSKLHETNYGVSEKKYWFSQDQISQILDPQINNKQISDLTPEQIMEFNSIAGQQLIAFGYEKLEF